MQNYNILLERKGSVAIVTFNRPQRRNAFDEHMCAELEKIVLQLRSHSPRAVVVTGAGKNFCAGFDVNPDNPQVGGLIGAVERRERAPVEALIRRLQDMVEGLVSLPVPVIAAVNGDAERALGLLEQAVSNGFHDMELLETDEDLAAVRKLPAFQDLINKAQDL